MKTEPYPIERIRADFPALRQSVNGFPLTYLDNAATALKPEAVVETVRRHYREESANIHRGVHALSQKATAAYEAARDTVQRFLNAGHREEIVFTGGTTAAINTVAHAFGELRSLEPPSPCHEHGCAAFLRA